MRKANSKFQPFWEAPPLVEGDEVISSLAERKGSSLFLGRYSQNEVLAALRKRNFLKDARKRNLWPLVFELDSRQYPLQRLLVFYQDRNPKNLIVDLKIREGEYALQTPFDGFPSSLTVQALILEWLTLQDPKKEFSERWAPLPGQEYPGLSLSKKIMELFINLARLTRKDCLLAFPAYFHNALLFSRYFHFMDPDKENEVMAIRKAFSHMPFRQLSWIVHLNCLRRSDGSVFEWKSDVQVYPLNKRLKDYFASKDYQERMKAGQAARTFAVDWETFRAKAG